MKSPLLLALASLILVQCGPPPSPLPAAGGEKEPAAAPPAHAGHHAEQHHAGAGEHPHGGHSAPTANHRFDDAERWSKVFDDPKRDAWQKPDEVVKELGLAPADVVADLGAGTGYFSGRLARAVPKGKVFAIDIEPSLVEHMKKRAEREGTANVEPVLGTASDPKLPPGVNVVLVVDTYHHIGERPDYFRRVRERLASGGRVVVVDFKLGKFPVGPPDDHKLAPEVVIKEMGGAGYQKCKAFDGLPYQYMLTFAEKC
ncbi:MAG: class I SAM-dependent methyltransferase [Polyangiaceae bacterium]|nr:class I SAM-dependent methyltransferase [Polyangiaceae bacterium]MCE7894498.1 class I SAM-dependent methyltransferase [Sorangiineae bacterium PRO1]MCL4751780.1 class I SAM-dependent methyltransferase [Myxococcales bacterium]